MVTGYSDTPIIPQSKWHVHDPERPQPRIVTPGNLCQLPPVTPPSDATVLFDGSSLDAWESTKGNGLPAAWELVDGQAMRVVPRTGNIRTRAEFGDCQLHVEWSAPTVIKGEGQGRGNSGVFLMGLYEVQVLDCFENPTYADGLTGALYGQFPPMVNACCKPGDWHVYDIFWQGPRFHGEQLVSPAHITVLHNGVLLHHHRALQGPTQHKVLAVYEKHPDKGPLVLQDHGDLVSFRNIWIREL